jgi:transposase IS116/IS110/IS902 family protein
VCEEPSFAVWWFRQFASEQSNYCSTKLDCRCGADFLEAMTENRLVAAEWPTGNLFERDRFPIAKLLTCLFCEGYYVLALQRGKRFPCGKRNASYVGLVPEEKSSGDRRRLGHISKQGNATLRLLLVEAAQVTVRSQPQWRSQFLHLAVRRGRKIAKVAMARKLAVHLYWMWRQGLDYGQSQKFGSHAGEPGNPDGEQ